MKLEFLTEPELEFGNGGTHIDVRFGLMQFGPLDVGLETAPSSIKAGIVGTSETVEGLSEWLDRCKAGIERKESRLRNLFPAFPGFSEESCFKSTIEVTDRLCSVIPKRTIEALIASESSSRLIDDAVDVFLQGADDVISRGAPTVFIIAPPQSLLDAVDTLRPDAIDAVDEELDEGSETKDDGKKTPRRYFHDVLKAKGMRLGIPIQFVRPHTYTGIKVRATAKKVKANTNLQDEATRAWNFHTALYYKSGGILWRLQRNASDLTTCFVGISFFRSAEGERLLTSVAQVFNERGEGTIVKGGEARLDKDDPVPHLSEGDSESLLKEAILTYRRLHRTMPARIVIHKTSKLNDEEMKGFKSAAESENIDLIDLISVKRSFTRLFRPATYPPLRGTYVQLEDRIGLIYLRGSINFFQTYPGLYVPRPFEFCIYEGESTQEQLALEMFSLSKLNWNNTQFDGGEPITVRAARRVGDILKWIPEGGVRQTAYRFYM